MASRIRIPNGPIARLMRTTRIRPFRPINSGPDVPFIVFSGLNSGAARIGNENGITVSMSDGSAIISQKWGTEQGGDQFGTAASPGDLTPGDWGNLWSEVTTAEGTYVQFVPIRRAPLTLASQLPQNIVLTVGVTPAPLDLADYVNGDGALVVGGSPIPGQSINGTVIEGPPSQIGQFDRTYVLTNSGGALIDLFYSPLVQPAAPVKLGDPAAQVLTENEPMVAVDLKTLTNGQGVTYAVTDSALPAGVTLVNGVIGGTPTLVQALDTVEITGSNGVDPDIVWLIDFTVAAAAENPVLTETAPLNDATDEWGVVSDQSGGVIVWARMTSSAAEPTPDGAGGWTEATLEEGTVPYTGAALDIPETGTTGVAYEMAVYHYNNTKSSNVLYSSYTADNTDPVMSITGIVEDAGEITISTTTNEGDGTRYHLINPNASPAPDAATIIATGTATSVTISGAQPDIVVSGYPVGTAQRVSVLHVDAHRNPSAIDTDTFTPAAGQANEVLNIATDGVLLKGITPPAGPYSATPGQDGAVLLRD